MHRGKDAALWKATVAYVVVALAVMVINGKYRQIFERVFVCSCFSNAHITECALDLIKCRQLLKILRLLQNQTLYATMQQDAMATS